MANPVASVIVPCRNAEKTVEAALAGPLASSLREIEVIAVDDGSTDGTLAALERITAKDDRVVVLRSGGRGVSAAIRHREPRGWCALDDRRPRGRNGRWGCRRT